MKLTYDLDAEALYITVSDEKVDRTVEVDELTFVDLDAAGHVRGIEQADLNHPLPLSEIRARYPLASSDLSQLEAYFCVPDSRAAVAPPAPGLKAELITASAAA